MVRARKLTKRAVRDRTREFLIEGTTGIREALDSGIKIELVFLQHPPDRHIAELLEGRTVKPQILEVSSQVMRVISATTTPPGEVAVGRFVDRSPEEILRGTPETSVILADVRDPGNVGTMLRTAWAVGIDAVFLGVGTADLYNPKVVRATAGAMFNVSIARDVEVPWLLDELGERGVKRIAADPRGAKAYDEIDMTGPCAFVFGNEAWGLSPEISSRVDEKGLIPMHGSVESVNVAIASAAFMFEAARQRRHRWKT